MDLQAGLSQLPSFAFCIDATYPGQKTVLAKKDFLAYAHRAYSNASKSSATKQDDDDDEDEDKYQDDDQNDDPDEDEDSDLDGAIADVHNERAELNRMSTAQFVIADEHECVHIACSINGAGEPQYQLVPALLDRMMLAFTVLSRRSSTDMAGEQELTYILRSDGMNHQKNLGLRAMEALAETAPELIWQVTHNAETGCTRAICASSDGKGHFLRLLVCFLAFPVNYLCFLYKVCGMRVASPDDVDQKGAEKYVQARKAAGNARLLCDDAPARPKPQHSLYTTPRCV